MSLQPPPKISLRHDHDWTRVKVQLGSTVDQQPEGEVVRQSRGEVQRATFSQLTQPIPKPIFDRSGQPDERNSSSAHTVKEQHAAEERREIASFNTDNEFNRKINEEDIDFNIPGLPHSTVKQLHSASVRE